jgi:hypothetical protein
MKTKHIWPIYFLFLLALIPLNAYRALNSTQSTQLLVFNGLGLYYALLMAVGVISLFFLSRFAKDAKEPISNHFGPMTNFLALAFGLALLVSSVSKFADISSIDGLSKISYFFTLILGILSAGVFGAVFISNMQKRDIFGSHYFLHAIPIFWCLCWLLSAKAEYDKSVVCVENMQNVILMGFVTFFLIYHTKILIQIPSKTNRRNLFGTGLVTSLFIFVYEAGTVATLATHGFTFSGVAATVCNLCLAAFILALLLEKTPELTPSAAAESSAI